MDSDRGLSDFKTSGGIGERSVTEDPPSAKGLGGSHSNPLNLREGRLTSSPSWLEPLG